MARKSVAVNLDRSRAMSLQEQLVTALRQQIRDGRLSAGMLLPSSRELASDLGVSRNTVIAAYDCLLGEGYLESQERSGVYVRAELVAPANTPLRLKPASKRRLSLASDDDSKCLAPRPFRPCQPDVTLFPIAKWNRMRLRAMRTLGSGLLHYQSKFALGLPILRKALAEYLGTSRGVRCDWQQIAITGGSQQALFLLAKLLIKGGETVWMENPGYMGAVNAWRRAGARLQWMQVDTSGAIPGARIATRNRGQNKLVYVTPSRQFPTGYCMPVARRLAFLKMIDAAKAWLVEDDYDSEFRYTRPPLPSLHSLDTTGRVIYLGSMSKVLFPTLRIGYLVLPYELVESFEALRLIVDDHGPMVDQAALAEFILSGEFYTHIRRCRKVYAQRLEFFLETIEKHRLPFHFPNIDGGMNQTGFLTDEAAIDLESSVSQLQSVGLDVPTISSYGHGPMRDGLVFGFTAFDQASTESSIAKVAKVISENRSK